MEDRVATFRGTALRGLGIATFLSAAMACAQTSAPPVPNAPGPKPSPLTVTLSTHPVPPGIATDASTPDPSTLTGNVTLYTAVDLALRNSRAVHVAEAERQRARASWQSARDVYIPNLSVGSGLGYSYGFPLGTPNIYNVRSQSLLFSFSQRDYIRAANAATEAATLSLKDVRQKVILDTALSYIDLNKTLIQIQALNQATADTKKLVAIIQDRLHAGLGTDIQVTEAELTGAKIHLRTIQMEDHADEIRRHLAHLTGLGPALIQPAASSIPSLPDLDFSVLAKNRHTPPSVQAAVATANSKMYAAWGDKRQNYRPTVSFVMSYERFATFNGYENYYKIPPGGFPLNNVGVGIEAEWPLFDPLRRDKAMESKAAARSARQKAELARIQNNENNYALWHGLQELKAQAEVARLEQKLAEDRLAATVTQMNGSSVSTNGAPITPQKAEQTRIDERNRYVGLEDAQFNVTRAKLELLKAVGELENWAKESVPNSASGKNGSPGSGP